MTLRWKVTNMTQLSRAAMRAVMCIRPSMARWAGIPGCRSMGIHGAADGVLSVATELLGSMRGAGL